MLQLINFLGRPCTFSRIEVYFLVLLFLIHPSFDFNKNSQFDKLKDNSAIKINRDSTISIVTSNLPELYAQTQKIITKNENNMLDSLSNLDPLASQWAINFYLTHRRFPRIEELPIQFESNP